MSPHIYSTTAVERFIAMMTEEHGYTAVQLNEGTLGVGDWVLLAPSGEYTNYIIKEVYLNEWSSGHTVERRIRIPKKYIKMMEENKK